MKKKHVAKKIERKDTSVKAREWLERGQSSEDPIEKLTNMWRGFNNLYHVDTAGPEIDKINQYLINNISEEFARDLIDNHAEETEYLLSEPVIDMRGNGRDTSLSIEEYRQTEISEMKLRALFKIIYQIRCNLEHGQKSPTRERDIELCKAAWPFLAETVADSIDRSE